MKRIMAFALAMLLAATAFCTTAVFAEGDAITYQLADCADDVTLLGRTETVDSGIEPHTTGAGIAFYSDCSGDIELTVTGTSNMFNAQYFAVYVDGVMQERVKFPLTVKKDVTRTLTVATGLSDQMHLVQIVRETEEVNASCVFNSITLNGTLTPAAKAPMLIEFVGDSITCGYGAYPQSAESIRLSVDHSIREAGTQTYAYLTAAELGMDFQACCTSGYGAECGWNGDGVNMQDMYPYTAYHHNHAGDAALWSFERKADIVVINLGTNDVTSRTRNNKTMAQIGAGMKALMEQVKEKNPEAAIVWCTGMMGVFADTEVKANVESLGGAAAGYYYCELPTGTSGGAGHPNLEQQAAAAEVLTEFLEEQVLPDNYDDMLADEDDMEELLEVASYLPGCDTSIARAEWRAAVAADHEYDGTLTTVYNELKADVTMAIVIVAVILVAIVAGVVCFAIFYKPKKPTAPSDAE